MSKKQFVLTMVLRIAAILLLLASAFFIWKYTTAPGWVLWVEGICALMQAGFLAGDCVRYQKI